MNAWLLCIASLAAECDRPPAIHHAMTAMGTPASVAVGDRVASPPGADAWFAEDKLRHFAMSFATTAFAYAGVRPALDPDAALIVAGTAALLAGIGKELHDARAGSTFSLKDMTWNAAGVALGLTLVHHSR
jgi:uncharacterized protein YfiM (DUF2279 family)